MKGTGFWIGVTLVIILTIIIVVVVVVRLKSKSDERNSSTDLPTSTGCVPFTDGQYQVQIGKCREKCAGKLLIPVLGIGYYNQCVDECKLGIPEVKEC